MVLGVWMQLARENDRLRLKIANLVSSRFQLHEKVVIALTKHNGARTRVSGMD